MATRRALVVGINDYPGTANDLPSCVEDAQSVAGMLGAAPYGFQDVRVLLDGQATIQAVTDGLGWLCGQGSPGTASQDTPADRLVFFFSGHGYRTEKDGKLRECIVLQDGFFFDTNLVAVTQAVPPGILTIILDSCFSGGLDKRFFELLGTPGTKELAERVRVKTWMANPEDLAKSFRAEGTAIPYKPFGRATISPPNTGSTKGFQLVKAATEMPPAQDAEPQVNGLLIAACQADQTASASSSQTQGKSAFTFCLLTAVNQLGQQAPGLDSLANRKLFDDVAQELTKNQFQQTPAIFDPPSAPDLETRTFVTLQAISGSTSGGAQPAQGATQPTQGVDQTTPGKGYQPPGTTTKTTVQGERSMPSQPASVPPSQPAGAPPSQPAGAPPSQPAGAPMTASDEAVTSVLPALLSQLLQLHAKDFQPSTGEKAAGGEPVTDEKLWGQVAVAAIRAAPYIWGAITGKGYEPGASVGTLPSKATGSEVAASQAPITMDEKSWQALLVAATRAAPALYDAFRQKGFQAGGEGNLQDLGLRAWQQAKGG